jgi:hypothetical protein
MHPVLGSATTTRGRLHMADNLVRFETPPRNSQQTPPPQPPHSPPLNGQLLPPIPVHKLQTTPVQRLKLNPRRLHLLQRRNG